MADEEDIAALVIDNGSGMCKGKLNIFRTQSHGGRNIEEWAQSTTASVIADPGSRARSFCKDFGRLIGFDLCKT